MKSSLPDHSRARWRNAVCSAVAGFLVCFNAAGGGHAQVIVGGFEGGPLSEIRPAPTFLKPDLNIITAQPSPSEINSSFLGPVLLMETGGSRLAKRGPCEFRYVKGGCAPAN